MDDLATYAENTWCPGCGNFGLMGAFKKAVRALEEKGIGRNRIVISAGIGCHGKIFDYLKLSGLYSIHGRSMATVQGMKIVNPDLKPVTFVGDGDAFGEGIAHMIFAAKRNADITVIMHDNAVYGLTTGQFTPVSDKGFKGPSTPKGSVEEPLNPLALMLESGATFVARGYPVKLKHLEEIMVQAIEHVRTRVPPRVVAASRSSTFCSRALVSTTLMRNTTARSKSWITYREATRRR